MITLSNYLNIYENKISYNLNISVLIVFNNSKKIFSFEEKIIKKI